MTKKITKLMLNGQEYEIREYQEGGGGVIPLTGLIAYYPFEEDWDDHKSELGVTGTSYDCAQRGSFSYSYIAGQVGNCISRTTTGNGSLNTGINLTNKFSLMFWMQMTTNNGWNLYISTKTSDGGDGFSFQFDRLTPGIKVAGNHYFADNDVTLNTWHHYALTQDGSTAILYVDGVGKTFTVNSNAGPNTLQIVGIFDGGTPADFDEFLVYDDTVLSAQEISDYYDATK